MDSYLSPTFVATPYCGIAPLPAELLGRWNLDPWLLSALIAIGVLGLAFAAYDAQRRLALSAAIALLFVIFVSPLCALASALFSARVAHHVILIAVAAPLLAFAFSSPRRSATRGLSVTTLAIVHAIVVWLWHIPAPYRFALSSDGAYWLMQLTLSGSAILLWREVFSPTTARGAAVFALLATLMQMGLLGALLVFAPRALFTPHFGTTLPFGFTELQDQQLAGVLMWVPAMLPYLGVAVAMSARWVRVSDEPAA